MHVHVIPIFDNPQAARLARQGYRVSVYEKNAYSGGRCTSIRKQGFRFDQGPSMYLMPEVFEETWRACGMVPGPGESLGLTVCQPTYRVFFHDGDSLTLSSNVQQLRRELERLEPGSFLPYLSWLQQSGKHYELSVQLVLSRLFGSLWDVLIWDNLLALRHFHIHRRLYEWTSSFFKCDKLRRAFTFQSMYMGMSPVVSIPRE